MKRWVHEEERLFDLPTELVIHMYSFLGVGVTAWSNETAAKLVEIDPLIGCDERYERMVYEAWFGRVGRNEKWASRHSMHNMLFYVRNTIRQEIKDRIDTHGRIGSVRLLLYYVEQRKIKEPSVFENLFVRLCERGYPEAARVMLDKAIEAEDWRPSYVDWGVGKISDHYRLLNKYGRMGGLLGHAVVQGGYWQFEEHPSLQHAIERVGMIRCMGYLERAKYCCFRNQYLDLALSRVDKVKYAEQLGQLMALMCSVCPRMFMELAKRGVLVQCADTFFKMMKRKIPDPECLYWLDRNLPKVARKFRHPMAILGDLGFKGKYTMEVLKEMVEHEWVGDYEHVCDPLNHTVYQIGSGYVWRLLTGQPLDDHGGRFLKLFGVAFTRTAGCNSDSIMHSGIPRILAFAAN